jgi:hypothetical protein
MHYCWDDLFLFVEFCNGWHYLLCCAWTLSFPKRSYMHFWLLMHVHGLMLVGLGLAAWTWFLAALLTAALHCRFLCQVHIPQTFGWFWGADSAVEGLVGSCPVNLALSSAPGSTLVFSRASDLLWLPLGCRFAGTVLHCCCFSCP